MNPNTELSLVIFLITAVLVINFFKNVLFQQECIMSVWLELKGKLDKDVVEKAIHGIAVRKNNGLTELKLTTRRMLYQFDLSSVITHYRIL